MADLTALYYLLLAQPSPSKPQDSFVYFRTDNLSWGNRGSSTFRVEPGPRWIAHNPAKPEWLANRFNRPAE